MNSREDKIQLEVTGGGRMSAFVARPKGEKRPGLIILQEAFGVNAHIRDVAKRFAQAGYVAVAPELFHRTAPAGYEGPYSDFAAVAPHFQAITQAGLEADLKAVYQWLQNDRQTDGARVGAVGYCMGGRVAFIANAVLPLKAAASFYGGRIVPDLLPLAAKQSGPLLLAWGGRDKHIGVEQQRAIADALKTAQKNFVEIEFSAADHAFMCDDRPSYHELSAKMGWALNLEFFSSYL